MLFWLDFHQTIKPLQMIQNASGTTGLQRPQKSPCYTSLCVLALATSCSSHPVQDTDACIKNNHRLSALLLPLTITNLHPLQKPRLLPLTITNLHPLQKPRLLPLTITNLHPLQKPPPTSTHYYESTSPPEAPPTSTHYYESTSLQKPRLLPLTITNLHPLRSPAYFHSPLHPSRSLRSASERRLVVPSQRGSNHSPQHSLSPFLAAGMIFPPPPPSGMLDPCQSSSNNWKLISFNSTWLHHQKIKKIFHVFKIFIFLFLFLASLYLFEQCLRLGVRGTSSVCLPLQD